jgi:LL-diaminopimelate aminotransferase
MINKNFLNLESDYLFPIIERKTREFRAANPDRPVFKLGVGDAVLPLAPAVIAAMHDAVDELGVRGTFRGYGPEVGYEFMRHAVQKHYERTIGTRPAIDEIFINDGAAADLTNLLDIFESGIRVQIPNPAYPAYRDANIMAGNKITDTNPAIIYLCSPNNPTGETLTRAQLKRRVDYALKNNAVIIFDAAYSAFVTDKRYPKSIYEIPGARKCAIEVCSLSKMAGFTGVRCGWTVVPHEIERAGVKINTLWTRRQTTKTNGVSYIAQRAAEAALSPAGLLQSQDQIRYYMKNVKIITGALDAAGYEYTGGRNSPYIWLKCPHGMTSWEYFDHLLNNYGIVGTPGVGFGTKGEGYLRLSAFAARETVMDAAKILQDHIK